MTSRRRFVQSVGAAAVLTAGGCLGSAPGTEPNTIRVGTYPAFVDAPSSSAGDWVKAEFESRFDYTLEWVVRENELGDFIQRRAEGVPLEADAYLGVTPGDLVRADAGLDDPLFAAFDTDGVENHSNVDEVYRFDPENRVIPTGASYVCIVYDERRVDPPSSLPALTDDAYSEALLLANPQSTTTGLLFLLWTVADRGPNKFLEYWRRLLDNDVHVLGSWSDAYNAYLNEEAPMVVSYSTDQVYAHSGDQPMQRHQIAFPDGQGYAYVDGLAKFATTDREELVQTFASFMLDPEVQRTKAVENVGLPTVANASLPEEYARYAHTPENPVQFGYDTLSAHMQEWRDAWARQAASK